MPASASVALSGQAGSVRPPQVQPHANGPSRSLAQGTPNAQHRTHKYSTSADMTDHRLQKPSQQMLTYPLQKRKHDKDLPTVPGLEVPHISRPTQMSEAERYKAKSQQKYSERDSPATPSSHGHGSLSSSHGRSHGHTTTTASQSSHTSGSSIGRHRSATVAGYHGGSGLDTSTSSSSSAQGHSSSSKLRRKPVRPFEEAPAEPLWEPGKEPMVISPSEETMPMTGSGRSKNRSTGVYRDPPTSATIPMNAQATWSRATGASAASSTKTIGQPQYVLQDAHPPLPSTTSLGRHHHSASASIPHGSQRTTVQTFWHPNGAPAASSSQTQEKLLYRASSSTGHGSGSANSSTPTPKANQFATTPTQSQTHANAQNAKAYKLSISAAEQAANATAPAGISYFTVPMNSSSDEQPRSTRGRKQSHGRTASASASGHAMSPSTASASTEGSSHGDGEGDSDLWKSGTSLSQMSQSHASMSQKRGRQHSSSQQRLPVPPQPAQRRSRGSSDAPAPQAHYLVRLTSRKDEKEGHRPGTSMSGNGDEERGRGRTKEKETTFFGRVRARSNSLTKGLSKAIQYPIYLAKGGSKRSSKQVTANANGSDGALAYSDHGGRTSGEDGFEYAYTPSTATTSTTTTSTAASPISSKHPGTGANGNPSKSSVNILPAQHQYTHKREHKRSFSAQPALGNTQALSPPPPPQPRTTGVAGMPSAFQRLKKPLSAKEREQRDLHRTSPMTRAKNDVLELWEGVDVDPRLSGVMHAQVQVSQSRSGEGIHFPRVERGEMRNYTPSVPFMVEQPAPRRR